MKLRIAFLVTALASSEAFVLYQAPRVWGLCMSTDQPTVEKLPDSAVEISIPVPGPATKAAYDKVANEISKNVQIPGFRKGSKIPAQVLEQHMAARGGRNAIKVQAINELTNQLLEPTLKDQALDPIGQPTLLVSAEKLAETFQPGEPMTLSVKCDVWPELSWNGGEKPYIGLKGEYTRKPFNQERMDMALRDLKERYATVEQIEDPSYELQMGDACTVNMVGYMATTDGEKGDPLPNAASGDRVEIILGDGRYMEGLVEGLVGAKAGETRTVSVSFPEKLKDKTLAGKKAVFDVEVLEASKRIVPEITDEFAAKVRDGLTAEGLMEELRKAIDEEDAKEFAPARNAAIGKALAEVIVVDIPDTLVTNQAKEKFAMMMSEMRDSGVADDEIKRQITPENFEKYKDIVKDDIIRDFKVSMASDEIARLEGVEVPNYQVEEQLEAVKKEYAQAGEKDMDDNMLRAKVEGTLQRQAVMDWLAERADLEVKYEDDSFDEELMEKLAQESLQREETMVDDQGKPAAVASAVSEPAAETPAVVTEPVAPVPAPAPKAASIADNGGKYSNMSLEERAYQILVDTGALQVNPDPSDPDYDASADDEEASS